MRKSIVSGLALLPVLVALTVAPVTAAEDQPQGTVGAGSADISSLGRVSRLVETFDRAGFSLQEGSVEYMDSVKEACLRRTPDALGNNPWPNACLALKVPQGSTYELPFAWTWTGSALPARI